MSELKHLKSQWEAVMSCMGCGDCGYAIRPAVDRYLTCPVKEAKGGEGFEIYFSRGRMNVLKSLLLGQIPLSKELADFVYQCSECGNCTEVCHMSQNEYIVLNTSKWIDHVKVWEALRQDLIEAGFAPLDKHGKLIDYMNDVSMRNPYGEEEANKFAWISEFPEIKEEGDLILFGGCTMPLRQVDTLKSMMKIFKAAGREIAMSKNEWCCGSIALRIGDQNSLIDIIKHNVEIFKEMGAQTIFTACAGCYRTWKKDYPELLGEELPFKVKHITEILTEMLNNNEIPFKPVEGSETVTWHDPCHLGRHMNLYEIPRDAILKIPGLKFKEMKRNRNNSWCCGAGGGVKSEFPDLALDISTERIKEAIDTGAQILTTSCPFCIGNFSDAYKEMEPKDQEKINIIDIIDLIAGKI
ncbi:MAG: (Fe-S)-binding protein [Candidatus Lokiarchaeota archaeon]|nr:(Fe-S)-binding protein [Candidatus Lokiarchaeota archaeon]